MPRLEDFYTVKAAATEIGIEYKALLARINRGKVAHERMGERIILIPTAEVQRLRELGNC